MKKILTIIMGFMLIGVDVNASPLKIELELFRDDDTPIIPNPSKGPEEEPCVYQDDNVITFDQVHDGYTLCIVDANDIIVYSAYVPSTQTIVYLPTTLSGEYQLRLIPNDGSNIYFYGYVLF